MQIISRLYNTEENARNAWNELKRRGYADSFIFTPPPRGEEGAAAPARPGNILDELVNAYILRGEAEIYARRIGEGASLVAVHAPFARGHLATSVLERHGPIDSGISHSSEPADIWDEATPLSSALRLRVLAKNEHPFETLTGLPSIIHTKEGSGAPARPDNPAPFSSALGLPLLTNNPAPLSSLFNLPLLLKGR